MKYSTLFNDIVVENNDKAAENGEGYRFNGVNTTTLSMPGVLKNTTGSIRWYPPEDIDLNDVLASVGEISNSNIVVTILKNGIVLDNTSIPAGENVSSRKNISGSLTTNDYLTVDIVASGGEDLAVSIRYSYS